MKKLADVKSDLINEIAWLGNDFDRKDLSRLTVPTLKLIHEAVTKASKSTNRKELTSQLISNIPSLTEDEVSSMSDSCLEKVTKAVLKLDEIIIRYRGYLDEYL